MVDRNVVVVLCLTVGIATAQVAPPPRSGPGPRRPQGSQQQSQPASTKPDDLGSVQGQIINATTGEPLRKASVTLRKEEAPGQPMAAITDAAGAFSLTGVEAGTYRLFAERNGFVRQEYGARGPDRAGTAITIEKGQQLTSLALRLLPQAVITGRIVDEDGEPVRGVNVQAMRIGYNQGRRRLVTVGSALTNDLGEYRVYDLPSGKYYVSAVLRNAAQTALGKDRYLPVYYPGSTDPLTAAQLEIPPGSQMRGIDMTLRRGPTVVVRGKIANPAADSPGRGASVRLLTRGSGLMTTTGQATPIRGDRDTFEIRGVTPGAYTLVIDASAQRKRLTYRQPIDVGPSGVDGLTITVPAAADLAGQVRLDGQGEFNFSGLTVSLRLRDPAPVAPASGKAKPDGSFTIEGLMPDSYDVNVAGLPSGYYVKSARFGSDEVLDSGLSLTSGMAGKLDIVVSPAAAAVDGMVRDSKQQPVKGATVALIPDPARRSRTSLFKTASTDDGGHYTIQGVTPGDYTLYAFEDVESGAYLDPDFLKPLESSAEAVTLKENGRESRHLRQIPIIQ
jgi:uncharacterized protein (DUF2141 family)